MSRERYFGSCHRFEIMVDGLTKIAMGGKGHDEPVASCINPIATVFDHATKSKRYEYRSDTGYR